MNRPIPLAMPQFVSVLADAKVSTNVFLRRLHNYCLGMEWLLRPVIPRLQWPRPEFKSKRAITFDEHQRIVEGESNLERRDFYELLWHTGASQSDAAFLLAEDVDWTNRTLSYSRRKLRNRAGVQPAILHFGEAVERILRRRPSTGSLFPYLRTVRPGDRATEFKQRCTLVGVSGVSLHSYRYAWAERALKCGYPRRYAEQALGHNSRAIHHAYARRAEVVLPSLDDWEQRWRNGSIPSEQAKIVAVNFPSAASASTDEGTNSTDATPVDPRKTSSTQTLKGGVA